jgi:hypothetical protein
MIMKPWFLFKISFLIVFLFSATLSTAYAEKMTDRWRLTGFTKYRDAVFADTLRLAFTASGTSTIWVKIAPATRSTYFKLINEYLGKVNKSGREFKSIEILCEFNCSSHLIRFLDFVYLDNAGNVIHEALEKKPAWFFIRQGNIWYNVEKEACVERK